LSEITISVGHSGQKETTGSLQDVGQCRSTSASVLAALSDAFARSRRFNQEEAAERCGLHRTYYSGIERGIRNVSLVNIEKVAKGLKTSLPKLFERV